MARRYFDKEITDKMTKRKKIADLTRIALKSHTIDYAKMIKSKRVEADIPNAKKKMYNAIIVAFDEYKKTIKGCINEIVESDEYLKQKRLELKADESIIKTTNLMARHLGVETSISIINTTIDGLVNQGFE